MARWRLTAPHYLKVPGTHYIYEEVDRVTGKLGRKIFNVPLLLHPDNPGDYNYPGEIIVCYDGKGERRDIVFEGPPTPEMEPLDDEATKISDRLRPSWNHPIDSLPGSFDQSLISRFEKEIDEIRIGQSSTVAVKKSDFEALKEQVALLVKQNAELAEKAARRL